METATSTERFELLTAPRGAPDDLAKLTGVGPQIVKKLNEHGVYHYWQIAAMTEGEAEKLDADLKLNGRVTRDNWVDRLARCSRGVTFPLPLAGEGWPTGAIVRRARAFPTARGDGGLLTSIRSF